MSINEVPNPSQEITRSEILRDTLWQHLPNIARVCSGTVKVEYLTSEPAGFLQVEYEPENGELDVVYTELIYVMSPITEMLVRELVDRVPIEQSLYKNIQPGDIPAKNNSRKARQVYCSMDGTTGEISVYAEKLGTLNDYGVVEEERDIAASTASTPEKSLILSIFGPTETDPDLATLAHTMNMFNKEKHDALLKVFEQI